MYGRPGTDDYFGLVVIKCESFHNLYFNNENS